jgi:hypothetical protein
MIGTFLRHGSNALLGLTLLALGGAFVAGAIACSPVAVLIGAGVFFVNEYTTHRFLFHAKPSRIGFVRRLQHRLHYDHHVDPARLDLLFLPVWFVVPVAGLFGGVFYAVTRDVEASVSLLFGSLLAMSYYEWVHYVAHIPVQPRTPWGRWMKKYHLWHHFKNERLWFGVTNPSMDLVGLSFRRVAEVEKSGSTQFLYSERMEPQPLGESRT